MKNFLIITILFLGTAFSANGQIKSATLTASGLTCSMCSKSIFKALEKVPSVEKIIVDVKASKYNLKFREGAAVSLDAIKKAVTDAGFSVAKLEVTAGFSNTEVANDAHINLGGTNLHFVNVPKQTLNGDKTFVILDKAFLSTKEHKKYGKYTKMACYETGKMAACCTNGTGGRIYHVTL